MSFSRPQARILPYGAPGQPGCYPKTFRFHPFLPASQGQERWRRVEQSRRNSFLIYPLALNLAQNPIQDISLQLLLLVLYI